jgi:hypothetical protein
MGIFTSAGTKVYITATTTNPATFDATGYGALTFTEIKGIESVGSFGDESAEVTFDDLGEKRTKKFKGQRNAGNMAIVCGLDDADAGQDLLRTAEADNTTGNFHFKVVYPNQITSGGDGAIRYFSGKVMTQREVIDAANNIAKLEATVGINTAVISVDAD